MKGLRKLALFFSLLLALPALAFPRSRYILLQQGGMMADDKGGFSMVQIIKNNSERVLWLTVRQGEGASTCEVKQSIEPWKDAMFKCDLAELKPGKVPVEIAIFADEERTQNLETLRDVMRFDSNDVRQAKQFAQRNQLPATFDGIAYFEKFGFGSALRQFGTTHAAGKLEVSAEAIAYSDAKRSVSIPLTAIRRLDVFAPKNSLPSIFADY